MKCKIFFLVIALVISLPIIVIASTTIRPEALHSGDTVELVAPSSLVRSTQQITFAKERLAKLGLRIILGKSILKVSGHFAGNDQNRADDINTAFSDNHIKAIIAITGGYGATRILPLLNYDMIKTHPKIILGFSDITALLLAIHHKTGLVTYHGPMPGFAWPTFSADYLKKVLFQKNKVTFHNPTNNNQLNQDIIQTTYRTETIHGGTARGILIGGNLTLVTALLGTPYEPDWNHKILFLEETHEDFYQVDRLLSELQLAGVLNKISGLIFGQCTKCAASADSYGSDRFSDIIRHYIPDDIPCYIGAAIGHNSYNFTLPEGILATMDADQGTISLLQPAVR